MPKKKKPATELDMEHAAKRLFPAKIVRELKKEAHKHDEQDSGNVEEDCESHDEIQRKK